MKYLLLMNYGGACGEATSSWTPQDMKAHFDFQCGLSRELTDKGELVDEQGLAGPEAAKIVTSNGHGAPVITDGPFPEGKEFLAGYRVVDVETEQRAIDIAARMSAAPGAGGAPIGQPIEVRQVMSAPSVEV